MYTGTLIQDTEALVADVERKPMIGTTFNASPEFYDRLQTTAKECGVSVSQFCRTAIGSFMADMEDRR